jgi:TolA-binding protein
MLLGESARLSGMDDDALEAFSSLRSKYPGQPQASMAGFLLGRVAFDGRHNYVLAAQWFSKYLEESPGGPLSREAAGRLMEALAKSGDLAKARLAARDYLSRYPEGPLAAYARSLLP